MGSTLGAVAMEPIGATETFPTGTTGGLNSQCCRINGGVAELQHHLNMVAFCCIMYVVLCCITFCRFFLYDGWVMVTWFEWDLSWPRWLFHDWKVGCGFTDGFSHRFYGDLRCQIRGQKICSTWGWPSTCALGARWEIVRGLVGQLSTPNV